MQSETASDSREPYPAGRMLATELSESKYRKPASRIFLSISLIVLAYVSGDLHESIFSARRGENLCSSIRPNAKFVYCLNEFFTRFHLFSSMTKTERTTF